tara:strand:+ start:1365 stop:1757 length:393 start_codon:yes stop_codon:yes gene_type:complete
MNKKRKISSTYGEVQKQEVLSTRDPRTLIKMLFDKACTLLKMAIRSGDADDDEDFQKSSLHALQIVLSLRFVLDTSAKDDLSTGLFETYTAIAASLFRAKEKKDLEALNKIYLALDELREAWDILLSKEP